jgi:hypothetical protein
LTFLVVTLVTVTFLLSHIESPAEKASLCLGLAMLLSFTVRLKPQTPLKRTMAFTVIPFGFIATTLLARPLRSVASGWQSLGIMFGIAIAAFAFAGHVQKTFRFVPMEAWLETARTIERRLPKGTEVVAQFRPELLSAYLSADYPPDEAIRYRQVHGGETDCGRFFVYARKAFPNRSAAARVQGDNGSATPRR